MTCGSRGHRADTEITVAQFDPKIRCAQKTQSCKIMDLLTNGDDSSEVDTACVKAKILHVLADLDIEEIDVIKDWIRSDAFNKDLNRLKALKEKESILSEIADTIRESVPFDGVFPSEDISYPKEGRYSECTEGNTCHIDEFLYDDEQLDKLVKEKKFTKHYCLDCKSRNTAELILISHSLSRLSLTYVLKLLLPADLGEKRIVDIGSRLGAVLFAAYHLTNAKEIIGVEINEDLCHLQEDLIKKYKMDSQRVKVVCSDVMKQQDIIANSDIFIINVFDFFVEPQKQIEMWRFFRKFMRKGSYLVTVERLDQTLENLGLTDEFTNWVAICKRFQQDNDILFDADDIDYDNVYFYVVI